MTLAKDQERIFTRYSDWSNHGPIYLCVVRHCDYSTYPRGRQNELTVAQRNERARNHDL